MYYMDNDTPGSTWKKLEPLLEKVSRPSRYIGGEWNAPDVDPDDLSVALAYPDIYEIGISNLGLSILLDVVNDLPGASAQRVYSPWVDMESEMRSSGVGLFTLETHRPVAESDILGISVPHELSYTNILNLLDLAGIPLRSSERAEGPLVIGGGCCMANPEPLAEFFDAFVLGEGERAMGRIVEVLLEGRSSGWNRKALLQEIGMVEGVYRPSQYEVSYRDDGTIEAIEGGPRAEAPPLRNVVDLDEWCYPRHPVVPFCEAVHDRLNVELFRGCTRGCRFCQAGMIYRPVRERAPGAVVAMADELSEETGHDEISLCSLSSTDYTRIEDVASKLSEICSAREMELSMPSLRMDGRSVGFAVGEGRHSRGGLTFAPEAGTDRLRALINKPISERDMVEAVSSAVRSGRRRLKLYFMIGLPTETDDDVGEISKLISRIRDSLRREKLPVPAFNISVSTLVPKPHTPFQWVPQEHVDAIRRKQEILKETIRGRGLKLSWHDPEMSTVEGLLARGDRRLGRVVEGAWRRGARFDSWSEHFEFSRWEEALVEAGLDFDFYLYRERGEGEILPWNHLDFGLETAFLYEEYQKAMRLETTDDCRGGECQGCGVCGNLGVAPVLKGQWG